MGEAGGLALPDLLVECLQKVLFPANGLLQLLLTHLVDVLAQVGAHELHLLALALHLPLLWLVVDQVFGLHGQQPFVCSLYPEFICCPHELLRLHLFLELVFGVSCD